MKNSRLQSLCSGNMLVCKNNYYIGDKIVFKKGRSYSFEKIRDDDILVDCGNGAIWFDEHYLWMYFYSLVDLRREKLNKLGYGFKK